jgi:glycosyltransferase involved in cell wall biosynthesis
MNGTGHRRRILYLIDYAINNGGAERFALGLATHMPADRFEVWLCSTRASAPEFVAAMNEAGVHHVNLGRNARLELHRFGGLARLLSEHQFDIVHSHMFGSNFWGTLFGRAYRVPVLVAHEHNWSFSGEHGRVLVERHLIARLATRFVAVSEAQAELMVSVERIPRERIVVMPTAYIPSPGAPDTDIRAELNLPPDAPLIGTAAILRVEKALEVLLEAHVHVLETVPDAHLVIAGSGDCRDELEQHAAALGLDERVHFLGMRTDVDAILRAFDVGAMSSDWEGMPLFIFECMAARTPLVATAVGGIKEAVEDGRTGLLVPPRDPRALGEALVALLQDPERRRQLADAAAQRLDAFHIDAVTERFVGLYDGLLAERDR